MVPFVLGESIRFEFPNFAVIHRQRAVNTTTAGIISQI
jgi:hypothetical protein